MNLAKIIVKELFPVGYLAGFFSNFSRTVLVLLESGSNFFG
jgi:hypothetical protein